MKRIIFLLAALFVFIGTVSAQTPDDIYGDPIRVESKKAKLEQKKKTEIKDSLLFLAAQPGRKGDVKFPVLSLAAFSCMLTTPSWGTFLNSLGGIQTLDAKGTEEVAEVFVHPLSAAALLGGTAKSFLYAQF